MIADFHNDVCTQITTFDRYLSRNFQKGNFVIPALFFNGNNYGQIKNILDKYSKKYRFGLENIGYGDVSKTECVLSKKPIYSSLTWNGENDLGYGCNFQTDGIKQRGRLAIKLINGYGVALDTAHLSRKGFFDAIDLCNVVINSHTCFCGVYNHKRNITDEQIKLIIAKNGLIGLCLYKEFLTDNKSCDILDVVNQIDYFVQKFGTDNLCLGSDFYGAKDFPKGLSRYDDFHRLSKLLTEKGYDKASIDKILYKNLKSFTEKHCI